MHSSSDTERIERGLQIALFRCATTKGDRKLVGLGSYIVNAVLSVMNGCHSACPATEFAAGQARSSAWVRSLRPEDRESGYVFGRAAAISVDRAACLDYLRHRSRDTSFPSCGLMPDEHNLLAGGFAEFYDSLRHGIDPDHLHPNCNGTTITSNCFNPPFNGNLLQVMPWPNLQELSDHDLHAIYTYLTAVPCVVSPGHSCS